MWLCPGMRCLNLPFCWLPLIVPLLYRASLLNIHSLCLNGLKTASGLEACVNHETAICHSFNNSRSWTRACCIGCHRADDSHPDQRTGKGISVAGRSVRG